MTLLEPEQEELLGKLVEASRNVPRDQRRPLVFMPGWSGDFVSHPGFGKKTPRLLAYQGDMQALNNAGLLVVRSYGSRASSSWVFDISAEGYAHYAEMRRRSGMPLQQMTETVREYLSGPDFRRGYSNAWAKWDQAEQRLWDSEGQEHLSTIGHLCREAVQEFATALVERFRPEGVDENKAHDMNRLRAVVEARAQELGGTVRQWLYALIDYWGAVSDLIQRQEHAGLKEGEPLVWEDARRVVYQTASLMFEVERTLR